MDSMNFNKLEEFYMQVGKFLCVTAFILVIMNSTKTRQTISITLLVDGYENYIVFIPPMVTYSIAMITIRHGDPHQSATAVYHKIFSLHKISLLETWKVCHYDE